MKKVNLPNAYEDKALQTINYVKIKTNPKKLSAANDSLGVSHAYILLSRAQKAFLSIIAGILSYACFIDYRTFLFYFLLIINMTFLIIIFSKLYLIIKGKKLKNFTKFNNHISFPVYSILVPLYKEANVISDLIENLSNIYYPKNKLQILLLLEEDDKETLSALSLIKLPNSIETILIPPSFIRTKPYACNYGLKFAKGKYVTIYDAEDCPHPMQLLNVVYTFEHCPDDFVCVQAKLNYYNCNYNWLTAMFSIEYAILFERLLVGLENLNMPITLGGSSNHFKTDYLKRLGGWDAYNVTEDADIGIRLKRNNFRVKVINSYTQEEAPISIRSWLKQRTRWIKGFIQTFFVHMRNPIRLYHDLGLKGFLTVLILLFICNGYFILTPIIIPLTVLMLIGWLKISYYHSLIISVQSCIALFVGLITLIWSAALFRNTLAFKYKKLIWAYPSYFLLHAIAGACAIYQIVSNLHYWNKTEHGFIKKG